MKYQILDDGGNVINTIIADEQFVRENYPDRWVHIPGPITPLLPPAKTEEEKLADAVAAAVAKLVADGVLKQA